jgi:hypothetical protein
VFQALDITPVTRSTVITASNTPHECDFYDVSLSLVANGSAHLFPDTRVMEADCWQPDEGVEAIIGMDILFSCNFQLLGPERQFILAF